MEDLSLFDHLVRDLDSDERRALLVRMQDALPSYPLELVPETELEAFAPEVEIERLGFFRRLRLVVVALFSRRSRAHLLKDQYLHRLGDRIRRDNPTLMDFRAQRFLPGMHEELSRLGECARCFRGLLETALGSERRAFVAFLARGELRQFQFRVMTDTDPAMLWERLHQAEGLRETEERLLREEMLRRFEQLVTAIPEAGKRRLYRDSGALYALHLLADFDFEGLRSAFTQAGGSGGGPSCPFPRLMAPLRGLAESLSIVSLPPSPQALYDLILFSRREQFEAESPDLEQNLKEQLALARVALEGIRSFHQRVPLVAILRYVGRDPYYLPRVRGGGEDWFLLYQEFWRRKVHQAYLDFVRSRERRRLEERCLELMRSPGESAAGVSSGEASRGAGYHPFSQPEHYHDHKFGADTPVRHSLSVALLQEFVSVGFPTMQRPLKLIYLNGEFYKEDNRRAFTDAFHFLDSLGGRIAALEQRLGPSGDLRAAIQAVKDARPSRRQQSVRIREVLARADLDARTLAEEALVQLENLAGLLRGILRGRPGERFDSLANLNRLGGRENRELIAAWGEAMGLCERAHLLLREILTLELAQ